MAIALIISISAIIIVAILILRNRKQKNSIRDLEDNLSNYRNVLLSSLYLHEHDKENLGNQIQNKIGTELSILKSRLSSIKASHDVPPLKEVIDGLDVQIKELRKLSNEIRLVILERYGLKAAIWDFVNMLGGEAASRFDLQMPEEPDMTIERKLLLFRITQDLILRVSNQNPGEPIRIFLNREPSGHFQLRVNEFVQSDKRPTTWDRGLQTIRNKAMALQSKLSFDNSQNGVSQIILDFPEVIL